MSPATATLAATSWALGSRQLHYLALVSPTLFHGIPIYDPARQDVLRQFTHSRTIWGSGKYVVFLRSVSNRLIYKFIYINVLNIKLTWCISLTPTYILFILVIWINLWSYLQESTFSYRWRQNRKFSINLNDNTKQESIENSVVLSGY